MTSLGERLVNLGRWLRADESSVPARIQVAEDEDRPFESGQHYFQIVIKRIYLRHDRKWATEYYPMAFALSEFTYGGQRVSMPFVVGPGLLGDGRQAPDGMIYENTRVAGLHPFRGGRVNLALVLYRVERRNYVRDLLRVVETAAGAVDFATALTPYLKVASAVVEGVDSLRGTDGTEPRLGLRTEFGKSHDSPFVPSTFALIDDPGIGAEAVKIADGRLLDTATNEPFTRADYVLFAIEQFDARDDETTLPFEPLRARVVEDSMQSTSPGAWESAKGNLLALQQALFLSPDLTDPQAEALADKYESQVVAHRQRAMRTTSLSKNEAMDSVRERTSRVLDLQ